MIINVILEDYVIVVKNLSDFNTTALSVLQLLFMVFYFIDTILQILTYGFKKHLWHFVRFCEVILVLAIFVISIIELVQDINDTVPKLRTKEFFLRLAKFYLIARKISTSWMKLE